MSRRFSTLLATAVLSCAAGLVQAGTTGSFEDGQLQVDPGPGAVGRIYLTSWSGHTSNGTHVGGSDLLFWDGGPWATLVLYSARIFVTTPSVGTADPDVATLTTVYGKLTPGGTLTGFDPGGTEFMPTSPETHHGINGGSFTSHSSESVAASALAAYLPGYDLTGFDTGSSQQYRVFMTDVPLAAITAVPEPGTQALWLAGAAGLAAFSLRRRNPAPRAASSPTSSRSS